MGGSTWQKASPFGRLCLLPGALSPPVGRQPATRRWVRSSRPPTALVAYAWYGNHDVTSPSLIADAWADFSYAGVLLASVIAGAVCQLVDLIFLARGKSVVAIAVLCATLWGIVVLLTTALNTALLSGGLLLAPVLAAAVAPKILRPVGAA